MYKYMEIRLGKYLHDVNKHKLNKKYICKYKDCGEIFHRLLTYNKHIKSHEIFPKYYEYKKNPKLLLDSESLFLENEKIQRYQNRISLSPMIQQDLNVLQTNFEDK